MASAAQLMRLASPALLTRSGYFCPCVPLLFDGTFAQTPAMGEDHLRRLLEADPNNAFLWTRLGNLLRTCCQCAAASAAYVKALALDPGDLEARYHLYRFAAEDDDTAGWLNHARLLIRYFHEGRRCQDEDLSEGIALKVLDDLLKAPADRRSQLPHCPDGSARPREAAFLAAMFAAPGEPRAILESAFECLMAGKDFALAR
jgi:tetratricopeptide (TPR) repeat protein